MIIKLYPTKTAVSAVNIAAKYACKLEHGLTGDSPCACVHVRNSV